MDYIDQMIWQYVTLYKLQTEPDYKKVKQLRNDGLTVKKW